MIPHALIERCFSEYLKCTCGIVVSWRFQAGGISGLSCNDQACSKEVSMDRRFGTLRLTVNLLNEKYLYFIVYIFLKYSFLFNTVDIIKFNNALFLSILNSCSSDAF